MGWSGDDTRGADGLGTDGVDLVWLEVSGREDSTTQRWSKYETWTAKYTTDPTVLAATKRRLRSETLGAYAERYVVGCGYAAVRTSLRLSWGQSRGIRVIRLSDGVSWMLNSESAEQALDMELTRPRAITCDELFASALVRGHADVVRIRLDSLGPGTPPD